MRRSPRQAVRWDSRGGDAAAAVPQREKRGGEGWASERRGRTRNWIADSGFFPKEIGFVAASSAMGVWLCDAVGVFFFAPVEDVVLAGARFLAPRSGCTKCAIPQTLTLGRTVVPPGFRPALLPARPPKAGWRADRAPPHERRGWAGGSGGMWVPGSPAVFRGGERLDLAPGAISRLPSRRACLSGSSASPSFF